MKRSLQLLIALCILSTSRPDLTIAPKYATLDRVMNLEIGMSKEDVVSTLGIPVYDLKTISRNGEKQYDFKYRVYDRKVTGEELNPSNGEPRLGKYDDLVITFSKNDEVIKIEGMLNPSSKPDTRARLSPAPAPDTKEDNAPGAFSGYAILALLLILLGRRPENFIRKNQENNFDSAEETCYYW